MKFECEIQNYPPVTEEAVTVFSESISQLDLMSQKTNFYGRSSLLGRALL